MSRRDRGTVTAELAVVLPALVLLAVFGVWAVLAVAAHLRCVDAAGTGARALARGESPDLVTRVVDRLAPAGAEVLVGRNGDLVVVQVSATVRLPGPWAGVVPGLRVGDRAVAVAEGSVRPNGYAGDEGSPVGTGTGSGP